jgi:membrane protein EpsK
VEKIEISNNVSVSLSYIPPKGSLSLNLIANLFNLLLSIILGIVIVPYLIRKLGIESYGLIPLTNYFIQYLSLVSLAINSAVGRYLAIALERSEYLKANNIFNTAFKANLVIATMLGLLCIPIIIYLDKIVSFPPGMQFQVQYLFSCGFISFIIGLVFSTFGVSGWCRNRFDLINAVNILRQGVYLSLLLVLLSYIRSDLISVGNALVISAFFASLANYFLSRFLLPNLEIRRGCFDWSVLKNLFSSSSWITINLLGSILYLRIDLLIVNKVFGPVANGEYASVLQWSTVLRMLGSAISSVFGPPFAFLYAKNQGEELLQYARKTIRYFGLILALPIGLICGFSKPLLALWLGPEFAKLSSLLILLTIHLCINIAVYPLFELQTSMLKVKLPGLVTLMMGIMNFLLALFLATHTNLGIYGVALAGAIMLTLKNFFFTPIYGALILGKPWPIFYKDLFATIIATMGVFAIAKIWQDLSTPSSWINLIIASSIIGLLYIAILWVFMPSDDKALFQEKISYFVKGMRMANVRK